MENVAKQHCYFIAQVVAGGQYRITDVTHYPVHGVPLDQPADGAGLAAPAAHPLGHLWQCLAILGLEIDYHILSVGPLRCEPIDPFSGVG